MSWKVTHLNIQGVKGVLDRAGDFDFKYGKSLAIYAPNGCGKSGYADAIEYLFSKDGAVEHLGEGPADSEQGGKHAIPHVLAKELGVTPAVAITLREASGQLVQATRLVNTGRSDPLPPELVPLLALAPAHRVLRQHDLRRFVVDLTPRSKYTELARWIGIERLEQVLAHLTTTSKALAKTNPDREIEERLRDISKHTNGAITTSDPAATYLWCAVEAKRHLQADLTIISGSDIDEAIGLLRARRNELVLLSGRVTERYSAKVALETFAADSTAQAGNLALCETALTEAVNARAYLTAVQSAAKDRVFQDVWNAAESVLQVNSTAACPLCLTPWPNTETGSQTATLIHLTASLASLADLVKAQSAYTTTYKQFTTNAERLIAQVRTVATAATTLSLGIASSTAELADGMEASLASNQSSSESEQTYRALLHEARRLATQDLASAIGSIVIEGMPASAQEIEDSINHLAALKGALDRLADLERESREYRRIEVSFELVARTIQKHAAQLVDTVVSALKSDVSAIYQIVHPTGAIPEVHIIPDTEAKSLTLRVGFHSRDRVVPPAGYLSEAQVNTLGMALFLGSVRRFNRRFPFIVLDDIVSSYDADHRARIVDVIAEYMDGFQVFLTTHDERFYSMLKARLADKGWHFDRVTRWSLTHGPLRETDAMKPDQIAALINDGVPELAGNAVRQYMEEWLDQMCAAYEAYTVHKRGHKDYDRTLYELWDPFITRLKKLKGGFFAQHVEGQPCYDRLKTNPLLNYYSHGQSNPHEWAAIGDVKYVWEAFCAFEQVFHCPRCAKVFSYDRGAQQIYCLCGGHTFGSLAATQTQAAEAPLSWQP